ncbi:MAG: N-acetyltransferase [Tannerella sp.]|jgi:predicted GNAT family acetyltransferase|nr:N-acetyltransferase [Tannerella sp.]
MELVHEKGLSKGAFKIKEDGQTVAAMTYVWSSDDNFIIDHTEVRGGYQNKGLGIKMVEAAVKYARENNLTILPLCSFARSMFNQHPNFGDVRKI